MGMATALTIARLSTAELRGAAYRALAEALFGDATFDAQVAYCRWLFGRNPAQRNPDALPIYVCWARGQAVGQLAIIPAIVASPTGAEHAAGWCVDFHILPSHQRRGIGGLLLDAAHADFPLLMTLGQTDASCALFRKRGWCEPTSLAVYKRFLRPVRCVARKLSRAAGIGAPPARPAVATASAGTESAAAFYRCGIASDSLAVQSDAAVAADCVQVPRSAKFLLWRYDENPLCGYKITRIARAGGDELLAIWRPRYDGLLLRGVLVDVLGDAAWSAAELTSALDVVARTMRRAGIELFECRTSDPRLLAALPNGILATRQAAERFLIGSAGGDVPDEIATGVWRLMAGDCDVDTLALRGAGQ